MMAFLAISEGLLRLDQRADIFSCLINVMINQKCSIRASAEVIGSVMNHFVRCEASEDCFGILIGSREGNWNWNWSFIFPNRFTSLQIDTDQKKTD